MIWARMQMADGRILTGVLEDGILAPRTGLGATEPAGAPVAIEGARFLSPVVPRRFIGLWNNFHAAAERNGFRPGGSISIAVNRSTQNDRRLQVTITDSRVSSFFARERQAAAFCSASSSWTTSS